MGDGAHEFIADRDTAFRLADSYVLYVNTRPRAVVFYAALAVGMAAIAIGAALSGAWINSVLVVITGGAGGAVGAWIAITVQRNRLARQLRGVAGDGHRLRLEARDDALLLEM